MGVPSLWLSDTLKLIVDIGTSVEGENFIFCCVTSLGFGTALKSHLIGPKSSRSRSLSKSFKFANGSLASPRLTTVALPASSTASSTSTSRPSISIRSIRPLVLALSFSSLSIPVRWRPKPGLLSLFLVLELVPVFVVSSRSQRALGVSPLRMVLRREWLSVAVPCAVPRPCRLLRVPCPVEAV